MHTGEVHCDMQCLLNWGPMLLHRTLSAKCTSETLTFPAGQQALPGAMEEAALRELPPWMRAEASVSVSRSADSTGAAQVTAQQGMQQHASSTEQQDLQVRNTVICGILDKVPPCTGLLNVDVLRQLAATSRCRIISSGQIKS